MKPQGLPSDHRVRKRRDFERAYKEGHKVVTREFAVFARPNGMARSRLGVTATRRIGNAVVRNRARRLVREAYRTHRRDVRTGFDIVVVVRAALLRKGAVALGPILVRAANEASRGAEAETV